MQISEETTAEKNSVEVALRASLAKIIRLPTQVSQTAGTFPFSLEDNGNLRFSWLGKPSILHFAKFTSCIFAGILVYSHYHQYIETFGWTDLDVLVISLMWGIAYIADLFTSTMTLRDREMIQKVHDKVVQFAVDMITYGARSEVEAHLKTIEERRCLLRVITIFLIFNSVTAYLSVTISSILFGSLVTPQPLWLLVSLPFVAVCLVPLYILRMGQVLLWTGTLSYVWIGMKALRAQSQNSLNLVKFLQNWKRANNLVEEINVTFQWLISSATFTLLVTTFCTFYQVSNWLFVVGPLSLSTTVPGMICSVIAISVLCTVASEIKKEAKLCVAAIRDVAANDWIMEDVKLCRSIRFEFICGALHPPQITPGNFFQLGRGLLPPVG